MVLTMDAIKRGRHERGLTQQELATAAGVSLGTINSYEHGTRNITAAMSNRIEKAFQQIKPIKAREPQLTRVADLSDITTMLQWQGTRLNPSQTELLRVLAKTMINQIK